MPIFSKPTVQSALWSGSVFTAGGVLQDIEVVKQRIYLALNTPQGTDPLRPFFGTKIVEYLDRPIYVAAAAIKLEIADAIALWVPDVTLQSITYKVTVTGAVSRCDFSIAGTWAGKPLPLNYTLANGVFGVTGLKGTLIADAAIPYNRDGDNYMPVFEVDGAAASPAPTVGGYATMELLLADAKDNWSGYGVWGMGKDCIVCYLKPEYSKAKLRIDLV